MINELYTLYQCLQKCDINFDAPNQNVKTPGKSEGFIVGVNRKGIPETVEYIDAKKMANLWTIRKGQQNSFPFMKLKKSILKIELGDNIFKKFKDSKKFDDKIAILDNAVKQYELNIQNISLSKWAKGEIEKLKDKDMKLNSLIDLADRFPKGDKCSKIFLKELLKLLLKNAQENTINLIKTILIGDEKSGKIVCDVPLFYDVSDWNKYKRRVANSEMGVLVSNNLPETPGETGLSALEGIHKPLHSESFPDPNLPATGNTYLFSMNEDALCHDRYGKISSDIFPVSQDSVKAMHGAIKWCTSDVHKGKTWKRVPNIKRKQDLLIAYIEEKPITAIKLASIFTSFDVEKTEADKAVYEKTSAKVCQALKGESGLTKDSKVNVLVLTKIDPGRVQVVLSDSYTRDSIIKGVEEWQIAVKNHPYFSVILPGKKGEKAILAEPSCPSPEEVMRCLQNQWIKNGHDKRNVPGVALRQVYDMFLGNDKESKEAAQIILYLTLHRLGPLFIGIAGADHAGDVKIFSFEARKTVLAGISVLALALYKLGIKKEEYMRNPAFNLGRLLSFADGLHAQYCRLQMGRKDKDLPPQLIGNALLPVAFDNPDKAIALLGDRLRIYYAWATKVQGEDYKLVKWMISEMGVVSAGLEDVKWHSTANDATKAQVLLGYLARSKSDEK